MYRDLVYRPGEESYGTRDLVFRPGVDKSFVEVLPYMPPRTHTPLNPSSKSPYDIIRERRPSPPIMDEIPRTAPVDSLGPDFINKIENADRAAKAFLDLFMLGKGLIAGLPEPMSQEEFYHEVTKRMDRNKPPVQDVLRQKFGVGSFREGIQKGIFPAPPGLPGV